METLTDRFEAKSVHKLLFFYVYVLVVVVFFRFGLVGFVLTIWEPHVFFRSIKFIIDVFFTCVPSELMTSALTLSEWPFSFMTLLHVRGSHTLNT